MIVKRNEKDNVAIAVQEIHAGELVMEASPAADEIRALHNLIKHLNFGGSLWWSTSAVKN